MAEKLKRFSLHALRLQAGFVRGWHPWADCLVKGEGEPMGLFFSRQFDSGVAGNEWGRLTLDINIPENGQVVIYACAGDFNRMEDGRGRSVDGFLKDQAVSDVEKLQFFRRGSHMRRSGSRDILLYELKGRYLWFALMVTATNEVCFRGGAVYGEKVNLLHLFPQLYRLPSTFLERYLSLFSSVHVDLNRHIQDLADCMDMDREGWELDSLLELVAVDGEILRALDSQQTEKLLQNLNVLIMKKGTAQCIRMAAELVSGQRCIVAEQSRLLENVLEGEAVIRKKLYGDRRDTFTVILPKPVEREKIQKLKIVIDRLKPMQTKANVVNLSMSSVLDGYGYLDCNLRLARWQDSRLDGCVLGFDSFMGS